MKLRDIRLWQWLFLAIAFGIVLVWVHAGSDGFGDGAWRPGLDRSQFESYLGLSTLPAGSEIFHNLTIYPNRDGKTYVSGEYIDLANQSRYRKFEYFADESPDLRELLRTKYPSVHFTYAWWQDRPAQRAFWFGLPLCLIGLICPTLIRVFASKPPRAAIVTRSAAEPVAVAPSQIDELVEETALVQPSAAVAALRSEPQEPVPSAATEEDKNYEGEFYPVARHPAHKE